MVNSVAISELAVASFALLCNYSVGNSPLSCTIQLFGATAFFGFFRYGDKPCLTDAHFLLKQIASSYGVIQLGIGIFAAIFNDASLPSYFHVAANIICILTVFLAFLSHEEHFVLPAKLIGLAIGGGAILVALTETNTAWDRDTICFSGAALVALAIRDPIRSLFNKEVGEVLRRAFVIVALYAVVCLHAKQYVTFPAMQENLLKNFNILNSTTA
mmetsp:Transcript_21343/g.55472  ORF Transcript_21343/g.55472 Transcript_21343/m.55472 type:complete len:215 (-) Transcript_21343:370-1014(-)